MIELRQVGKRYGERWAVDRVSLAVERGELLVLLGGSGSGKTTTLKMINRLIEPTCGEIRLAGRNVQEGPAYALRRTIGYVFQEVGLFPHLTVAENVAVTPVLLGWERAAMARRVDELLERVRLDPARFRARRPDELSGGERQRVGLARALAARPEVMLLDEPFGAVDPLTRDALQQAFQEIRRELALTALFVTHDMVEALLLGDRIAVFDAGRLVQVGTPHELLKNPANDYVARLMASPRRQAAAVETFLRGPQSIDLEPPDSTA